MTDNETNMNNRTKISGNT